MAKKSEIIGEYIVTIDNNGSVSVSRIYKSTKKALREVWKGGGMGEAPESWTTQDLGRKVLAQFCNGAKDGKVGEYEIQRDPNNRINVIRTYSVAKGGLKDCADSIGFPYETEWPTRQFGQKLLYFVQKKAEMLKILNLQPEDDTLDREIEKRNELNFYFNQKVMSVLVIDPDSEMSLAGLKKETGKYLKYFDLSRCADGDYKRILKALHIGYDGLLFDNVDRIPDISDKEEIEELVRFSLKREQGFPLPNGDLLNFNELAIAVRCREYPQYLIGKSLQYFIIDMKN